MRIFTSPANKKAIITVSPFESIPTHAFRTWIWSIPTFSTILDSAWDTSFIFFAEAKGTSVTNRRVWTGLTIINFTKNAWAILWGETIMTECTILIILIAILAEFICTDLTFKVTLSKSFAHGTSTFIIFQPVTGVTFDANLWFKAKLTISGTGLAPDLQGCGNPDIFSWTNWTPILHQTNNACLRTFNTFPQLVASETEKENDD